MKMRTLFIVTLLFSTPLLADDDGWGWRRGPDVMPVTNPQYADECGVCHFAYQPGLLPAASWQKVMGSLEDHFGDNAELSPEVQKSLTDYLVANAADNSAGNPVGRRSQKIARSLDGAAPLRITEIPRWRHEHNEIPRRVIRHEKIGSLSNCAACHTQAAAGSFREGEIRIPGFGRWDD